MFLTNGESKPDLMTTSVTESDLPTGSLAAQRLAGWSAVSSGVIGFIAYRFLIAYLNQRSVSPEDGDRMLRCHDGGVILQFLLLIPVVIGLQRFSMQRHPGLGRVIVVMGVGALCFVIILLLLVVPKIVWDVLYMFPQGLFGVWLMVVNGRMSGLLPRWLIGLGLVVGLGLMLVGTFPLGYGLLVDPTALRIPAVAPEELAFVSSPANTVLHQILFIGSYLGVAALPFWSVLIGWRLLRRGRGFLSVPRPTQ